MQTKILLPIMRIPLRERMCAPARGWRTQVNVVCISFVNVKYGTADGTKLLPDVKTSRAGNRAPHLVFLTLCPWETVAPSRLKKKKKKKFVLWKTYILFYKLHQEPASVVVAPWCDGSSDRSFMVDPLSYFSFHTGF